MKKINFFTLLLLAFSVSCYADSNEAYKKLMDVDSVSVLQTGKKLSYVLKPGTIIGDCEIRQAKFYSDIQFVLVLRKTTGNALTNKFNRDHVYYVSNPSWIYEDADIVNIRHKYTGKTFMGMYYSTLNVKLQKSRKNKPKVLELSIKSSRLNKDLVNTPDEADSISCSSEKAENETQHSW